MSTEAGATERRRVRAQAVRRRFTTVAAGRWPRGAPGQVLLALLFVGILLRLLAIVILWPTTILEDGYQRFAATNPFLDAQHPAGYALILGALGAVTHEIAVPVLLQHITGIASALLLWAATRRITGSEWAGLLPAAIVLLDLDGVFLEHSIMSESWQVLVTSFGLYAAVRTLDEPEPWWRWPVLAGVALAVAVTMRSATLLMIGVVFVALSISPTGRMMLWCGRWRAPVIVLATAAGVLFVFAGANAKFGYGLRIEPSPGWYLYGRAAQFADCRRFTPPPGTAGLCERTPRSQRRSGYYYMFDAQAPAPRLFGAFGRDDGLIGSWAKRALRAQFGAFLGTAWTYLRGYYVPGSRPARLKSSTELDPQLDFTYLGNIFFDAAAQQDLEAYFQPFKEHRLGWGLKLLRRWQVIVRFGATALFVSTVLTLLGLVAGSRRSRIGVLLLGVSGLSMLVPPVLTGTYSGRYTVPMAGPLLAAVAITITAVYRRLMMRTRTASGSRSASQQVAS